VTSCSRWRFGRCYPPPVILKGTRRDMKIFKEICSDRLYFQCEASSNPSPTPPPPTPPPPPLVCRSPSPPCPDPTSALSNRSFTIVRGFILFDGDDSSPLLHRQSRRDFLPAVRQSPFSSHSKDASSKSDPAVCVSCSVKIFVSASSCLVTLAPSDPQRGVQQGGAFPRRRLPPPPILVVRCLKSR